MIMTPFFTIANKCQLSWSNGTKYSRMDQVKFVEDSL